MKSNFHLTVADILARKNFEHAKIVAGKNGLHRQVKWVHIVEVTSITNLLNGHELILSTGIAWKEESLFLSLLHQLIESEAAALCIEIKTNIGSIPESVLEYAEQNSFPIVVFEQEVPFVRITQDVHTTLIHHQYEMISKLEHYAQSLNKKMLQVDEYRDILQVLHKELHVPVLFQLKEGPVEIVSSLRCQEENRLSQKLESYRNVCDDTFISAKVVLFNQEYAELFIYQGDYRFSEYEHLLVDRTSTALAQYLMRELYVTEKKRVEESRWVHEWLHGNPSIETISTFLAELSVEINGGVVCICDIPASNKKENVDLTYFKLLSRSIFEQHGFHVLTENNQHQLIFCLLNTRDESDWKTRLCSSFEKIMKSEFQKQKTTLLPFFSTGKFQKEIMSMHKSYETAEQALSFRRKLKSEKNYYFYDDLHLFRLISIVNNHINMGELIEEYLAPILQYDQNYNGHLLETLKMYLQCQGSKKDTAKRLFVVRQTLYHRLKKIEELLGKDFMVSEKRVAIEFLLFSYDYLQPINEHKIDKIT